MPAVCEYTVVTKLNEYAISAAGVGEAMQRSAAALAAANNSFEESIGLIVAANTTAQDFLIGVPPLSDRWVNTQLKSVNTQRWAIPRVRRDRYNTKSLLQ